VETGVVFRRWKRFREEAGKLPFGRNVIDFEGCSVKMVSDKVIANVDVLCSTLIALSVGQYDRRLVICKHDGRLDGENRHFGDVVHAGKELANCVRESHVLGFHRGHCSHWLFL
jgi:hypothetical protein